MHLHPSRPLPSGPATGTIGRDAREKGLSKMSQTKVKVGIIGGSGLGEAICGEADGKSVAVTTPFGRPSAPIVETVWHGTPVALLNRHGLGHTIPPSMVPYRANIYALKALGCTHIIASGAVGSLRDEIRPKDLVIPDQVIDKTYLRAPTFFDDGLAVHVEFASPFCPVLRGHLLSCAGGVDTTVHDGGTYVCMEGPAFSTRAESHMHRQWGGDLIGMTCMPEARLAREAEIAYALVCLPSDYDCWKTRPEPCEPGAGTQPALGKGTEAASGKGIKAASGKGTSSAAGAGPRRGSAGTQATSGAGPRRGSAAGPQAAPCNPDKHELLKEIISNLTEATKNATSLISRAVADFGRIADTPSPAHSALELAIWTNRGVIQEQTVRRLGVLVEKYLPLPPA